MRKTTLIALLLLGLPLLTVAQSLPPLAVAVIEVGKPSGYRENGQPMGMYYDLSQLIFDELGEPYQLDMVPYRRMILGLDNGEFSCAMFFTSPQRKQLYTQVGKIMTKETILVPRKGLAVPNVEALEGKTVGYIRGSNVGALFGSLESNENVRKFSMDSYEMGTRMLQAGRLDGVVGGRETIEKYYDHGGNFLRLSAKETWLQCSKQSAALTAERLHKLKQTLARLHDPVPEQDPKVQVIQQYMPNYQRY